jgi:hypothetical protein
MTGEYGKVDGKFDNTYKATTDETAMNSLVATLCGTEVLSTTTNLTDETVTCKLTVCADDGNNGEAITTGLDGNLEYGGNAVNTDERLFDPKTNIVDGTWTCGDGLQ